MSKTRKLIAARGKRDVKAPISNGFLAEALLDEENEVEAISPYMSWAKGMKLADAMKQLDKSYEYVRVLELNLVPTKSK